MANNKVQLFFKIAVVLPVRETFIYAVPSHLVGKAEVGHRVLVPFRSRKVTGYILEETIEDHLKGVKEILDILDPVPMFHKGLVPFFQWMAEYYLHPIGHLIHSAVPGGLGPYPRKTGRITDKGLRVFDSLPAHSNEKKLLTWIKDNPGKRFPYPLHMAYSLQNKGWLNLENRTKKRCIGPLMRKFIKARDGIDLKSVLREIKKPLEAKDELQFLKIVFGSDGILLKELSSMFKNGEYLVNKWIKRDVLVKYSAPVFRNPAGKILFPQPVPSHLYEQQKDACHLLQKRLNTKTFSTYLLYGVTGSGKTEVYFNAIEHAIKLGRQAILMVPEIALAVYMEGTFRARLGDKVAIFHSGLSEGERYDQWIRMVRGDVSLAIGARSALFAPFPGLGLIIVDEEHDFSYKQDSGHRYQARDAAVVRGKIEKALVILGSGTPSIQSFHNAITGRYGLISMPERIEKRPLPNIHVVDMKNVADENHRNDPISPALRQALEQNLAKGKQALLFLNRRGFNRVYLCAGCGEPIRCSNCDVALVYHLKENRLVCHYCGFSLEPQNKCPSCGRKSMKAYGFGTERLEQELKEIFPGSRVDRMDRDSTRGKGHIFNILKKFGNHEIDILVGTQMITKGYDFQDVTLVGVIAADFSLGFPDFRAGERTFQILSQVAGRAGRGDKRGKVIIQTFNPRHYAIASAKDYDYGSFFQKEKELREELGYPPFSYLAHLKLQGNNEKETADMARTLGQSITAILDNWPKRGKEIQVLGPAEAPLSKLKGKYRQQILVKSKGAELLHFFLREVEGRSGKLMRKSGVRLTMDMDPYQML
ncbi:MAG: primosomal protein N' [Thermodesulfobacteriota bacterium]|nr:primosomal protein N' [Thermodesulfobacteriota bacterium]